MLVIEPEEEHPMADPTNPDDGAVATTVRPKPASPRVDRLPPWKVLLHNDDVNDMGFVVETIRELTGLNRHTAIMRMLEAHTKGVALLIATHRERAELIREQFATRRLIVSIEPE
ncbi:MAG: ATP-dependent Clp protease adaptor ClpS [Planctomycetota bacterium]|jgi:ATP-dependent Clp protease adaptor protein ClpS